MISLSALLKHYKRKEIQEEIIKNAKGREVAVKYGDKGFGKRPEILQYPNDIIRIAQKGATSFHISEEHWRNPLQLSTDLKKNELDDLRTGFDLVLDIDCPYWNLSKIITWLIIKSLKEFNINSISLKFSGNKGFHIGIPFESFPENIIGEETRNLFPDLPRKISAYLLDYISKNHIIANNEKGIIFSKEIVIPITELTKITGKSFGQLTYKYCPTCKKKIVNQKSENKIEFICPKCEFSISSANIEDYNICPKCKVIMNRVETKKKLCYCSKPPIYVDRFDPLSIIEVDTLLVSSRHLYRSVYSFNEKSGLVSVPLDPEKILEFDKKMAKPENVKVEKLRFLDSSKFKRDEAKGLIAQANDFIEKKEIIDDTFISFGVKEIKLDSPLPEQYFPPCVSLILKGLEDGKKRSLFILVNYLTNLGWDYEKIEERLKEWNKKNPEPLRENLIVGQIRYHKQKRKKILPPNCDNKDYYKDIGICKPDNLCMKIKNPVNYSLRKVRFLKDNK